MRDCDGCRFCCWSFNVHDVPDTVQGLALKDALKHCSFECAAGCSLHEQTEQPWECQEFHCPYQRGEDVHRPDTFQQVLEESQGNIGNYVPIVPATMDAEAAKRLIKQERCLPAAILVGGQWRSVILPLDRKEDGTWEESTTTVWK
jgi:hypothetical protein